MYVNTNLTFHPIPISPLVSICLDNNYNWPLNYSRVCSVTRARQAPLSFIISCSLLKFMSIESVMLYNHLILCCLVVLLPSIFPSIKVFFQWVGSLRQVTKVLELQLQHQSFQWIFRVDFLCDGLIFGGGLVPKVMSDSCDSMDCSLPDS